MDISTSLLAKGAAGALAATAAVGTGVAAKEGLLGNLFGANGEVEDAERIENPTEVEPRVEGDNASGGGDSTNDNISVDTLESRTTDENGLSENLVPKGSEASGGTIISATGNTPGEKGPSNVVSSDIATETVSGGSLPPRRDETVSTTHTAKKKTDLSKFDQGLIDFLDAGGDIVFSVKKGDSDEDFTKANLTFGSSGKTTPVTAKVIVSINGSNANLKEKDGNTDGKGKKETLQKLHGSGIPWIWSCKVKLKTTETPLDGKTINDEEKIFSSNGQGLLNVLKKDFSNGDNAEKEKGRKTKEEFIKSCAKERGSGKNKTIDANGIPSEDGNDLKSEIKINLKLGAVNAQDGKTDENKLYPMNDEDDKKFKELFGEITEQRSA